MVRRRPRTETATTKSVERIELERTIDPAHENHSTALEILFGVPKEQLHWWPGATAYCTFLESCFNSLLAAEYDGIWALINVTKPEGSATCWVWFNTVCSKIHELAEDNSIEDIWNSLKGSPRDLSQASLELAGSNISEEKASCLIAIFAVLCWASMVHQPQLRWDDFKGQPHLAIHTEGRWQQPIGSGNSANNREDSTALYLSTLNYSTLKTIGKIRLEWVESLSNHLDFDPAIRTLFVFRFPTFCLLSILKQKHSSLLEGLVRALYKADNDVTHELEMDVRINQEVLMSYRLLFGQERSSRILAESILKTLRDQEESHYDELLEDLCTRPCDSKIMALPPSLWPISCRSFDDTLQEEDSYSSQDDFPIYGQRLAKLQEFCQRQQPSRLRDLWRDRRSPLQWYTFWAVLIFGGLSIILSILQLAVGIGQLVVSA